MVFQSFPPGLLILSPRLTRTGDPSGSVKGINTTPIADGAIVYCVENRSEYQLDKQDNSTPADGNAVIQPASGPGRWNKGAGTGGGGGSFDFPGRVDCSVNAAYIESPYSAHPVLHTRSSGQVAGGYNGGGVGNKAIVGFRVGNGLPLGQLQRIEYTWLDLNPAMSGFATYANLIIDVNGNGTAYKIAVIDPASLPGLNNGTTVTNPDGSHTTTWLGASNNVLLVNGLLNPPLPPGGPGFVPPTVPGGPLPGGWPSNSYSLAAILAAYPNAKLAEASSGDGGLPRAPNTTPAFLLATGDSANQIIRAFLLSNVTFNGALV